MALLRLQTMATGRTGVRPATAQAYADLLNAGITPVVREYGSLGCSGDLAPLAHVALAVMGEGEVGYDGRRRPRPRPSPPGWSRWSSPRRRAWPSSTAPTGCSRC